MSDRTFRLILDGKKGGLVKGSTPSSAAKKGYKKLSAELGKTSIKFELQETTKDSKKKVYGPYKGCLEKDKIKVKMAGGKPKGQQMANLNPYGDLPIYEKPYNTTPQKLKKNQGYNLLKKIPNQHEIYNMPPVNIKKINNDYATNNPNRKKIYQIKVSGEENSSNNNNNNLTNL
jgi:hypothetical protein